MNYIQTFDLQKGIERILQKTYLYRWFKYTIFLILGFLTLFSSAYANAETEISFFDCSGASCKEITNNTLTDDFAIKDTISLQLQIKNPQKQSIYSAQTWLRYDPNIFEVTDLDDTSTSFELAAPGEFKADTESGIIKIGRAVAGTPITKENSIIADIELTIKKNPNGSKIEFISESTGIMTIERNVPTNLLNSLPTSVVFKTIKPAGSNSSTTTFTSSPTQTPQKGQTIYGTTNGNSSDSIETKIEFDADLPRPQGLRSRTYEDGKVENIWKNGDDNRIKGYYLYYSLTSGTYMHRKDLGKTNKYQFPNSFFEKGKRVYFSVQAYTSNGKLSDFSDETYLVIGSEGSESHPFFEQIFPDAESTGQDDENKYYGGNPNSGDMTNGVGGGNSSSNNTSYPTPKNNPQSGPLFNSSLFLILGGLMMIFAARIARMNRRAENTYRSQLGNLLPGLVNTQYYK